MSAQLHGYVYILRFSHPLGTERHQAQYYIGWTLDVEERLEEHRAGRGARITAAAVERGFRLELIATLPGTRADERRLKARKSHRRIIERLERGTLRYREAVLQ